MKPNTEKGRPAQACGGKRKEKEQGGGRQTFLSKGKKKFKEIVFL